MTNLDALRTVAACLHAVNSGDLDNLAEIAQPDLTVMTVPGFGPARPIMGIEGVAAFFEEARHLSVTILIEPYEVKLESTQTVMVHADYILKTGDDEQRLAVWIIYRLRDGLIAAIMPYLDREAAMAAVR